MTARSTTLFDVDPAGLAKLLEQRGKGFAVVELVSNAWDTNATHIEVELEPVPGRPYARLVVADNDPDGFADLRHAYTLFAESTRKADPTQRGRFNMGEKMVIVLCESASIRTTSGSLWFDKNGREQGRDRTDEGSVFEGLIRMTREEYTDAIALLRRLIVPADVTFVLNGETLPTRAPLAEFVEVLPTVLADSDGNLRPTGRKTTIRVYEPVGIPSLYELGVPIVETGDAFDIDISQKVPLNMERDNVTPAFLRRVRTVVLNATFDRVDREEAGATWISSALEDPNVDREAVAAVVKARFGDRAVIFDPSDREGSKMAVAAGYTVIPSGAFNKQQWNAVRDAGILPAGRVTPSPTAILNREGGPDAERWKMLEPKDWSENVANVASYARALGKLLLGFEPTVAVANDILIPAVATWGGRTITFNRGRLGEKWFTSIGEDTDALLLHEFAHNRVGDHLDRGFADEIARLAAKLVQTLLADPTVLDPWRAMAAV